MGDATDEAFARMQGGAATADPTEQAFAKMQSGRGALIDPTDAAFAKMTGRPPASADFSQPPSNDEIAQDPRFNTALAPADEAKFAAWKQQYAPQDSGYDYDLRGAFKAGFVPDPQAGHWLDTFKKPNHPTFSDQSKYAPLMPDRAGTWQSETYVPPVAAARPSPVQMDTVYPSAEESAASADTAQQARLAQGVTNRRAALDKSWGNWRAAPQPMGLPEAIGTGIAQTGANVAQRMVHGVADPIQEVANEVRKPFAHPEMVNREYARMTPEQRAAHDREFSTAGRMDFVGSRALQSAMGAIPAAALPMAVGGELKAQVDDSEAKGMDVPFAAQAVERGMNAPFEGLHKVGEAVTQITGSKVAGIAAELAALHAVGAGGEKIGDEIILRRGMKPNAAALAARAPGATAPAPEPPLDIRGVPSDISITRRPVPNEGVRVPPEPATGGPPVAGQLPTTAAPAALPDPNTFGRQPGVMLSPEEAAAAQPKPTLALPEKSGPTNYQGVIVPRPGPTEGTAATAKPVEAAVSMRFGGKKPVVGTPTVETNPDPGEGVTPSQVLPPAPETTPVVGGIADLGGKGAKSVETAPGRKRFGKQPPVLMPGDGTVPLANEKAVMAQGGPEAASAARGQVVVTEPSSGSKLLVDPADAPAAQAKAGEGKLAEVVNGEGTSPKPLEPTHIVRVPGVRDVLVDTPEKLKAALAANPGAQVLPATLENIQKALTDRAEVAKPTVAVPPASTTPPEPVRTPAAPKGEPAERAAVAPASTRSIEPVAAGAEVPTPSDRVARLTAAYGDVKPGEEFNPFVGETDMRGEGIDAAARIVDEGNGRFAAEGAVGYGDDPMRLIGKGTREEAIQHVARWADEELRQSEGGGNPDAPRPVEAEVRTTEPKALPVERRASPELRAKFDEMKRKGEPAEQMRASPTQPTAEEMASIETHPAGEFTQVAQKGEGVRPPKEAPVRRVPSEEWSATQSRKGHVYRGMSPEEFNATVGSGRGVQSDETRANYSGETSFSTHSDAATAGQYAMYGDGELDAPRDVGYVVEAKRSSIHGRTALSDPGEVSAVEETPAADVTRVWEVKPVRRADGPMDETYREIPREQWARERPAEKPARSKKFRKQGAPFHPDESPTGVFYVEQPQPDGSVVRQMRMHTKDVNVDPERFQHKDTPGNKRGLTDRLRGAKKWEEPTEPLSVWQDPADGKTYVVNGHQRMGVAERTGQADVPVKFIDAPDAAAARLEGAKENLRSGHASAADVARFFREQKLDPGAADAYLKSIGAQDTAAGIREGRALAALPDSVWDAYRHGILRENRAVAIGDAIRNNGLDEPFALEVSNAKSIKDSDLEAYGRRLKLSATIDKAQTNLFGDVSVNKAVLEKEAALQSELLDDLSKHKRQFGGVNANADVIESEGLGTLNKEEIAARVKASKENYGAVRALLRSDEGGAIDSFIREAAAKEHAGKIGHDAAFAEVRNRTIDYLNSDAMKALKAGKTTEVPPPEPSGPSLFGGDEPPPEKPSKFGSRGETGSVGNVRPGGGPPDKPIGTVTKAIERPYQKASRALGEAVDRGLGKIEMNVPGVGPAFKVARWAKGMFMESRQKIGPEYAQTMEAGEGNQRVARAEGEFVGRKLGDAINDLPGDAKDAVYRYLGGESDALPADLSPEAKALVDRGVALVNEGRDALVTLGRSSADSRAEYQRYLVRQMQNVELAKAYAKGEKGQPETTGSRPRLPERFSRQDAYEMHVDLPRKDIDEALPDAKLGVKPQYVGELNGTTLVKFPDSPEGMAARDAFVEHLVESHAKARRDLNRLSTNEFTGKTPGTRAEPNRGEPNPSIGQGKMLHKASLDVPRAADLNIRTADPLSPEMRELMGEDTNPATALARTIANVRGEVAKTEMLESVKRGKDAAGPWVIERKPGEKPSDAPAGYQHVSNKRLGPLDDMFVRDDIAKDIKGTFGIGKPADLRTGWDRTGDAMRGATDSWKGWRTVRNPAGHVQNAISGPMTAIEAGISPFNPENWAHFGETFKAMDNPDPFEPMQRMIIRNGIDEGAQLSAYELGRVRDTWRDPGTSMSYKVGKTITDPFWWTKKAQDFDQAAGRSYNFVDRVIRQSLFRKLIAEGMSEAEATLETDKFTTNYAKQGSFVKGARHMPFSPFITYAYERLRILKNNLAEHPVRAAASLAAGYALQQAIESTLGSGVSDEEKKGAHAEYGNSRFGKFGNQFAVVAGRHKDGTPIVWDTGSLFTVDRPLRGPKDALDETALESGAKWLLGDVMGLSSGPVFEQAVAQATGRDYQTGKEFLDASDRAKSFGKSMLPPFTPFIGTKADKIAKSFGGEQYAKTKPAISGTEALLDAILHIRVDGYAPSQSIQNALWELNRAEQPIEGRFNRDLATDPQGAAKAYAQDLPDLYKRFGKKVAE